MKAFEACSCRPRQGKRLLWVRGGAQARLAALRAVAYGRHCEKARAFSGEEARAWA